MGYARQDAPERLQQKSLADRDHALDGFRLLAALMVVCYHYAALYGGWGCHPRVVLPGLYTVARYGWLGVEFFFMISGFAVCLSAWGRSLGDYAISRASRIYPAYWVAVPLTASVVIIWPQVRHVSGWEVVLVNLTMVQELLEVPSVDGVYWTLFAELKFYLLFALVIAFGITYRKCVLFCGVWQLAGLAGVGEGGNSVKEWVMPGFAPYFIAGIAFSLMRRFAPNALLWFIVAFSCVLAEHRLGERLAAHREAGHSMPAWPAQLAVLAAFTVMAIIALGWLKSVRWCWLAPAGALTYPLYLIHQHIGMTLIYALRDHLPAIPLVLGTIVGVMGASWAMHRFCERPLSAWFRRALQTGIDQIRRAMDETGPAHKSSPARGRRLPGPSEVREATRHRLSKSALGHRSNRPVR
ncbi:acyltransferase family protein [Streptomyces syringium]|uniref:acyltransferase family protein n=1 Tax=Streptomyces syringium TaxID=76729 RepID=UPI0033C774E0